MRVLYYAAGGGMGHVTRAAAILRQVRARGDHELLALCTTPLTLPLAHHHIPFHRLADPAAEALRAQAPRLIRDFVPDVLVVDVFPAGIAGELAEVLPALRCRKILVYRHVKSPLPAELHAYDRVLLAETPPAPLPCPALLCGPILLRDAGELFARADARMRLWAGDRHLVLAVGAGDRAWTDDLFRLLRRMADRLHPTFDMRLAAPCPHPDAITHYPLLELLPGVDLLIGAAGYNLFHEARACGTPAIFLPQPRAFDDQAWRARDVTTANAPECLEREMRRVLTMSLTVAPPDYINGADLAADAIVGYES